MWTATALTFTVVTPPPAHGNLTGTAPDLTYTPDTDYVGTDSFTFIVSDNIVDSAEATVSIDVLPVNTAPVANPQTLTMDEDATLSITLTGSDLDGDSLTFTVVTPPAFGSLSGTAPDLTYTPDPDFNGADNFTFIVNDGTLDSAEATIDITVNPVNDVPLVDAGPDQFTIEGTPVYFNGSFTDIGLLLNTDEATLLWDFGDGGTTEGTLTPQHTYVDDGVYLVTLTVTDLEGGSSSDTLVVTVDNGAPALVIPPDESFEMEQIVGQPVTISGTFTDPGVLDAHEVTITWDTGASASLNLNAGEYTFSFEHIFLKTGVHVVTLMIADEDGGVMTQEYQVTITGSVMYLPVMRK
jgi:hypothetical protein